MLTKIQNNTKRPDSNTSTQAHVYYLNDTLLAPLQSDPRHFFHKSNTAHQPATLTVLPTPSFIVGLHHSTGPQNSTNIDGKQRL